MAHSIVIVKVHRDKILAQCPENLEIPPVFISGPEVKLSENLVNILQVLGWEIPEGGILSCFNVYFESDMFVNQVVSLEDVHERLEVIVLAVLAVLPSADVIELVHAEIGLADWCSGICAIVLIVGHWVLGSHLTPGDIPALDANVDHGLREFQEILAKHVATLIVWPISGILTISVLDHY